MATFNDYVRAINKGSNTYLAKIEFLNLEDESIKGGEGTLTGQIISGGISKSRNNGVRRSVSLRIVNLDGIYTPEEDGNIWINSKFRVSIGIRFYNDRTNRANDEYFIQQGIFVTRDPQVFSEGSNCTLTLEGLDKFSLLDGQLAGVLDFGFLISNGTDIITKTKEVLAIKLDEAEELPRDPKTPLIPPITSGTTTTPYTIIEKPNSNLGKVLEHFRFVTSRDMYYDLTGRFVFKDNVPDTEKGAVWHFSEDENTYISSTNTTESSKVINKVVVEGANVNGNIALGVAENRNLLSSTCIQKIGTKVHRISVPSISTDTEALKYARYVLNYLTILQNSLTIVSAPIPHLEVDEIVTFTDRNHKFIDKRFVTIGIDLSIEFNQMSITLIDTDEFIEL